MDKHKHKQTVRSGRLFSIFPAKAQFKIPCHKCGASNPIVNYGRHYITGEPEHLTDDPVNWAHCGFCKHWYHSEEE